MTINLKKSDRTIFSFEGRVPEDLLKSTLRDVLEEEQEKFVSSRYEYDAENDETRLWIMPCRTFVIEPDPVLAKRVKCPVSCERKLLLKGGIPDFIDLTEKYWMPYRKQAKKANKNSQYVVMYSHPVFTDELPASRVGKEPDYTEVCLIVDSRCPHEEIPQVLDAAAAYMAEKLRLIVSDVNPRIMHSAIVLDKVMLDFADAIAKHNDDELERQING